MKRVLVTGATGFTGSNVLPLLRERFDVLAPGRRDLDVRNQEVFERFVIEHQPDVILHLANPNPAKNENDADEKMFRDSLDSFLSVYRCKGMVDKVVYLGSGAEFDKRFDISGITESDFGRSYPKDAYGAAKYVMNELSRSAENIINLRLFACYGPGDHWTKFITHCIRSVLSGEDITIRQDCRFDYLHVDDLSKVIVWSIENNPRHMDYNVASGESHLLSEIANKVIALMGSDRSIILLSQGLNKEYTASVERLKKEYKDKFIELDEGIRRQIEYEKSVFPKNGYLQL